MEAKDQQSKAIETAIQKEKWAKPELTIKTKESIESDPTVNDDGLAAGLFS